LFITKTYVDAAMAKKKGVRKIERYKSYRKKKKKENNASSGTRIRASTFQ
jgi:hypothetical protein